MEDGKGARKSDDITATPTRIAPTASKNQQSEREQEPPKKPRSVLKKDLTEYFGQGKRTPAPTTEGNPIKTVIQRREMQVALGTSTGKEGSATGEGGTKDDSNNSWLTPLVKRSKQGKKTRHLRARETRRDILPKKTDLTTRTQRQDIAREQIRQGQ